MPRLYPRLDPMSANQLAEEHKGKTIEELSKFSSCEHSDAIVAPVGGTPVRQDDLKKLVKKVRTKLSELGYPQESDRSSRKQFDYEIGKLLFEEIDITLGEAALAAAGGGREVRRLLVRLGYAGPASRRLPENWPATHAGDSDRMGPGEDLP